MFKFSDTESSDMPIIKDVESGDANDVLTLLHMDCPISHINVNKLID